MAAFLLCFRLLPLCLSFSVCVLQSSFTPFSLPLTVQSALFRSSFPAEIAIQDTEEGQFCSEADIALDYSYQEFTANRVQSEREKGSYVNMWRDIHYQNYGDILSQYLRTMNLTNVFVLSDSDIQRLALAQYLLATQQNLYRELYVVPRDESYKKLRKVVGRQIKPRGICFVVVLLDSVGAYYFLKALEEMKLNRPGYAYFLSQEAGMYRYLNLTKTGLLASSALIVSDSAAVASTREAFESSVLSDQLLLLQGMSESEWHTAPLRTPAVALLTVNRSQATIAALSPSQLTRFTTVQFPGNSSAFPTGKKPRIRASVNYQIAQPDGSLFAGASQLMRGFQIAFRDANSQTNLIPAYSLEDASVGFTGVVFSYNFSKAQVASGLKDLGLICMLPPTAQSIIGIAQVFAALKVPAPITSASFASELSDPRKYPLFVRPRVADNYQTLVICRLIQHFGWKRIAVLFANNGAVDSYQELKKIAGLFDIQIVNSEETRILPALLNNDTAEVVNKALTEIIASDTRIIFILHSYTTVILEQMYDLGIREEYVILVPTGLVPASYSDPSFLKRRIVSKGALMFYPRVFIGDIGADVYKSLSSIDHEEVFPNTCFLYDSAFLYFYATQYLLERGLDYEDPYLIVKAMRETHFYGCSGFVKIQHGTNDRDGSEFMITNFQYDRKHDSYELKIVGSYNPYSTQPYQFTSPIQWPDDEKEYSDLKPLHENCHYLSEVITGPVASRVLGVSLSFALTAIALGITVPKWRKWRNIRYPLLVDRETMSTADLLALVSVVFDFFLLAAMGTDLSSLSHFLSSLCAVFTLNLESSFGIYGVVNITFALVCFWVALCFILLTRAKILCEKRCIVSGYCCEILMPTAANLLFIPITSKLMSVISCYHGLANTQQSEGRNMNCEVVCWSGKHLAYSIGCVAALLVYVPVTIVTRPRWQILQSNVHVKPQPFALFTKSAFQLFLVALFSTLKRDFPSLHAYLFFSTMIIYLLYIIKYQQFNYDRLNLWQVLLTLEVLSLSIAGFLATLYPAHAPLALVISLGVEFPTLVIVGEVLQRLVGRFRSMLVREKAKDLRGLFTFAFTAGERAARGLQEFYRSNGESRYKQSEAGSLVT